MLHAIFIALGWMRDISDIQTESAKCSFGMVKADLTFDFMPKLIGAQNAKKTRLPKDRRVFLFADLF
ncbi:MAG: hypothetical protein OIF58_13250 [Cohaesibacter sp.]|nr:hypothetical protein [Cohaesibacter sp.]